MGAGVALLYVFNGWVGGRHNSNPHAKVSTWGGCERSKRTTPLPYENP
jgi:hypothetical protein